VTVDAALELVAAYLRVNGYFLLTELEFHEWDGNAYRAITDVDVVAVRFPTHPGPAHYRGGDGTVECLLAGEVDPAFEVATDRFDVVIGEVKRGEVSVNRALWEPRVLHAVLRRIGDVTRTSLDGVVDELSRQGRASTAAARLRLVAFGNRGTAPPATAMHHDHLVDWLNVRLRRHQDLLEVTNFSDPVLAVLSLTARIGRSLAAPPEPGSTPNGKPDAPTGPRG